jgi:hypothetical protein
MVDMYQHFRQSAASVFYTEKTFGKALIVDKSDLFQLRKLVI